MRKFNVLPIGLLLFLIIESSHTLLAHSIGGFFVSNGQDCYLAMPNWHFSFDEQEESIQFGHGVFIDLNRDGFFSDPSHPIANGSPGPLASNTDEFYMFTNAFPISDLDNTLPGTFPTWEMEVEAWFNNNIGSGYDACLVWEPSASPGCTGAFGHHVLITKLDVCPVGLDPYFATVTSGFHPSTPCTITNSVFEIDCATGFEVALETHVMPIGNEQGRILFGLVFLSLAVLLAHKNV